MEIKVAFDKIMDIDEEYSKKLIDNFKELPIEEIKEYNIFCEIRLLNQRFKGNGSMLLLMTQLLCNQSKYHNIKKYIIIKIITSISVSSAELDS